MANGASVVAGAGVVATGASVVAGAGVVATGASVVDGAVVLKSEHTVQYWKVGAEHIFEPKK